MKKILVNFSYKLIASRGIARFTENILSNLKSNSDYEIIFLIPECIKDKMSDCLKGKTIEYVKCANYFMYEHYIIPKYIRKNNIDILFNPANTVPFIKNCEWISVVHDIIPFRLKPKFFSKKNLVNFYVKILMKRSIVKSKKVITVSEYSKNDILKTFNKIPSEKVHVVYNGFNHNGEFTNEREVNLDLPENYVFWLGGDGYNKNLNGVVELLKTADKQYSLVSCGVRRSENIELLQKYGCKVLVDISDKELEYVYKHAKVFLFPSLYEGFGIPVLEAMANKVPYIIASNATSIPEVCGDCCYLCEPTDYDKMREHILDALSGKLDSKVLMYEKQLGKFNWSVEAQKVDTIFKE